jgi:hypothetical protein
MVNFGSGKIYEIRSDSCDKRYIGSTTQRYLATRFATHKQHYKMWKNGKYHKLGSFEVLQYPDAKIYLLENFPCTSKAELSTREGEWIKANDDCCNINECSGLGTLSKKEWQAAYEKTSKGKETRKRYEAKKKIKMK